MQLANFYLCTFVNKLWIGIRIIEQLIIVVLIGFALFNQPSQEELQAAKHKQDSIALAQKKAHDHLKIKQDSTFLGSKLTLLAPIA
ncbi:MAG: hypothetical protein R2847_06745 [Bacteroidia bacterium]